MNAYELADEQAFKVGELSMWTRNHTAAMLRQQADEIKLLRQGMKDGFDGLESMTALSKAQADEIVKLRRFIDERGETGAFIVWRSKEITK